jgi:hypothetical protein
MRPTIIFFALLSMLACVSTGLAQDLEGGGIVYGSEIGVLVSAPKGWMFDAKSGVPQGLYAVMYPAGSTWADANVMIYVNIVTSNDSSLETFIAGDIDRFKEKSPKIAVEKAEPISVTGGSAAEVRLFSGDRWGNYECVAYASKGKSVAMYVISSRSKEGLIKNLDAFRTMVSKSVLMNVTIQK